MVWDSTNTLIMAAPVSDAAARAIVDFAATERGRSMALHYFDVAGESRWAESHVRCSPGPQAP